MTISAFDDLAAKHPKYFMMAKRVMTLDQVVIFCIVTPLMGKPPAWDDPELSISWPTRWDMAMADIDFNCPSPPGFHEAALGSSATETKASPMPTALAPTPRARKALRAFRASNERDASTSLASALVPATSAARIRCAATAGRRMA